MRRFSHFGGVDFSGAREPLANLWAAVGEERDGKLHVLDLRPLPYRADLARHVVEGWRESGFGDDDANVLWGVDFPLGLPRAAAVMLAEGCDVAWDALVRRVASAEDADAVRGACDGMSKLLRDTDRCGALSPLDLRLYKQTVEGLRWLHELCQAHGLSVLPQAPRDEARCTVIEVYPSVTRTDVGIKPNRKPRREGEIRARPAALEPFVTFDHPAMAAAAVTLEDAWDAVLACVTAWLVRDDLDQPTRAGIDPQVARLEGWIYRHPGAVGTGETP